MLIYNELDDINDYDNGAVIIKNPKYFKKGKNYVDIPLCFINKENVFEEINDIGRKILKYIFDNSLNKNNKDYHTIANQIYSENLQLIYKKYEEWNNNNGFPYSFKQFYDGDDGLGLFLDDCIFLSLCNEINIWLFKLQLGYDITNRFYNLISLLNMNMINETYYKYRPTAEEYYKITYDRVPSKEEIREYHFNIKEIIPNAKNNRKANEEVCNSLRKVLVDLINDKLDKNDYFITRLVPIFNQTTKEFTLYNKSKIETTSLCITSKLL